MMLERNDNIIKQKMKQYIMPGIMLTAALQIGNIVDTMLVGNLLGPEAMSAVKIGMTVDNIVELPGYVLGVGGSVASGILMGERETEKAKKVFSATMVISILLGLLFAVASLGAGTYAQWLCSGSSLVRDAERFIFVTLLIGPIFSIALQVINYVAVDNNPALASAYVITANVINLVMDYLLLKYTNLGTAGAALSTGLGYGLALLIMIFYVKSEKRMLSFVNPFGELKKSLFAALKAGVPTLLYMIFLTIKDMSLNTMIIKMVGETAMIIYTVCFNAMLCVQMIAGGIVGLLSSMGSVLYGKHDYFGIKKLIRYLLRYSYVVLGVFILTMLLKPQIFLGLFGVTDRDTVLPGIIALRIYTVSLPFYLWNHFMMVYYQSTDKTVLSGLITSLQTCVAIVPLAYVFVLGANSTGKSAMNAMVLSLVFSEIVTLLITLFYQRIRYKNQNFFMIPKQQKDVYDFSVSNNSNQIQEAVLTVFECCEKLRLPEDTSKFVSDITETLLMVIFTCAKAENTDISIDRTNDCIHLRFTDDGVSFNPLEEKQTEDEVSNLRIEAIRQAAKQVKYLRVIDTNYVTIEIAPPYD